MAPVLSSNGPGEFVEESPDDIKTDSRSPREEGADDDDDDDIGVPMKDPEPRALLMPLEPRGEVSPNCALLPMFPPAPFELEV